MSKVIFQISNSGTFSEPENGLELLPTNFDTVQSSRYTDVKIVGRKGGVSQYLGIDRKKHIINGVFLGDYSSMSTKKQALENLLWNTDSAERGKPVTMSIVYNESGAKINRWIDNEGLEDWVDTTSAEYWIEETVSGGPPYYCWTMRDDTEPYSGNYAMEFKSWNPNDRCIVWSEPCDTFGGCMLSVSVKAKGYGNIDWPAVRANGWVFFYDTYDASGTSSGTAHFMQMLKADNDDAYRTYSETMTAPSAARSFLLKVEPAPAEAGYTSYFTMDELTVSGPAYEYGYTASRKVNINGYNISQRRGAKNIYDVSIDMEEEY